MRITSFKLAKVKVPLKTPFKTALRTVTQVEDIIVIINTDTGHKGYGEAPATAVITGDTHGSIIDAITNYIMPPLLEMDITNLEEITHIIQNSIVHNSNAKAAVEIAVYDLFAQSRGAPLYQVLGGGTPRLITDLTISVDTVDKMVGDSLRAIEAGYTILKIKVGNDIALDMARIKAIYSAVKERAQLRLDVNQGWTAAQTVAALEKLDAAGVVLELVEQPVKAHDFDGMKFITKRVSTPIMADESAFGPKEVMQLIQMGAADIINIKLMKAGGISNALEIVEIAKTHNVECMIGCMLETSISVSAAAHLAVSRPNVITRIDLDGPQLCAFDPVKGGASFNGPEIVLSSAPGLGIQSVQNLKIIGSYS